MFTPQSAPRHRAAALRSNFTSSPLARSPMLSNWRGTPTGQISSRPSSQASSRSDAYAVESSRRYNVKLLRTNLPSTVAEFSATTDASSVVLHSTGWAWIVSRQHQLALWRYDDVAAASAGKQSVRSPRPVSLPASPTPYSPSQICIFTRATGTSEGLWGVVAVSGQGHVRYWPQWPKSSSCSDIQLELPAGHDCVSISDCMPHGCMIATQKGDLFLLSVSGDAESSLSSSTSLLSWRSLHTRNSTLAGLRRRVSSLFFVSAGEESDFKVVAMTSDNEDVQSDDLSVDRDVYVLGESTLEQWHFSSAGEKMTASVDLNSLPFKQAIAEQLCDADPEATVSFDGLHVEALDLRTDGKCVYVLVSVTDRSTAASSVKAAELFLLGISFVQGQEESVLFARKVPIASIDTILSATLQPRLLQLPHNNNVELALSCAFTDRHTEASGTGSQKVLAMQAMFDRDQLGEPDNKLLVLLIGRDFIPSVKPQSTRARTVAETSSALPSQPAASGATSFMSTSGAASGMTTVDGGSLTRSPLYAATGDRYLQLRGTFLTFCQSENQSQCQSACQQLFPMVDADLDRALAQLSCELINDRGVSDPRWAERHAMTADPLSTAALLSAQQDLQNKQHVLDMFLQFVISMEWWDKLGLVTRGEHLLPTEIFLGEHSEKVAAAAELVSLHCKYPGVLDKAVEQALAERDGHNSGVMTSAMSPHHRFYHQVENVSDIISSLVACLEHRLSPAVGGTTERETELFVTTNLIIEEFLSAASQRRQKTFAIVFTPSVQQRGNETEYVPWTASSGPMGVRTALLRLFMLTVETALPGASSPTAQQEFHAQLGRLADHILSGYRLQLDSAKAVQVSATRLEELETEMEQTRRLVIQPFLDNNQRETARRLAEVYGDFGALISLAESVGDDQQLMKYMCRFAEEGFPEYVFKYYLDQGKLDKLLTQPPALHQKLAAFLEPHHHLRWLHCLALGDFKMANQTLHQLSVEEDVFLAKKKTLLSLAKLSYLASSDSEAEVISVAPGDTYFSGICREQEMIRAQEDLPPHITEGLQLDFATMRPLLPDEMMEALVGDGNEATAPEHFVQALRILRLTNPSAENLIGQSCRIWSQAIVKEQAFWQSVEESEHQDSVANTLLCRSIRQAADDGLLQVPGYLPPPATLLLSSPLAHLKLDTRPAVVFWIQAAYDHVAITGVQQQEQQQQLHDNTTVEF